jgi:hypothetical protein
MGPPDTRYQRVAPVWGAAWRWQLACVAVAVAGGLFLLTGQTAQSAGAYQCYVRDSLTYGFVPNTIQASGSVDCSGYGGRGSVKFTVRLIEYDADAKRWKVVASKSRRFKTLRKKHLLDANLRPCVTGRFRATFKAVLHNASGGRVSTNNQKLGPLKTQAPCNYTIR